LSHRPSTVSVVDSRAGLRPGFAVVDVETTGFDPAAQRIVEIGVVILDAEGRELSSFCSLVDPGCDPGPTHIHGISSLMLDGAPSFAAIHPYVADQLTGRVMVGHNVDGFDQAFLEAECRRVGGEELAPQNVATVDTLVVAQEHLGLEGGAKLVDCCDHFGLSWTDHHSALGDARVTAALFRCLRETLGDEALGISSALEVAGEAIWPGASATMPLVTDRSKQMASGPRCSSQLEQGEPVPSSTRRRIRHRFGFRALRRVLSREAPPHPPRASGRSSP
jgi:DNA polymerase-3 subunit epsilon